jgi:hypothetical protein
VLTIKSLSGISLIKYPSVTLRTQDVSPIRCFLEQHRISPANLGLFYWTYRTSCMIRQWFWNSLPPPFIKPKIHFLSWRITQKWHPNSRHEHFSHGRSGENCWQTTVWPIRSENGIFLHPLNVYGACRSLSWSGDITRAYIRHNRLQVCLREYKITRDILINWLLYDRKITFSCDA